MRFEEFKYERPNLEVFKDKMNKVINVIGSGVSVEEELKAIQEGFKLQDEIGTLSQIVGVRNSIDTRDEFYDKEQAFFDENSPHLQQLDQAFMKKLLESNNRNALEKEFGSLLFKKADLAQKTFSPEIIPQLQAENKLSTEYSKLLAGAKIEFKDGTYNLSQMGPFMQDLDRETRHQAQLAVSAWFEKQEEKIDDIYDQMVKLRSDIANKLGYDNFVQLGYDRMGRTDYNAKDVKSYRDQIFEVVVPIVSTLVDRKAKRLGIEHPKSYDLGLQFLDGNPTPKGDSAWQLNQAKAMYEAMSPETGEFINFMVDNNLLDLDAKEGKMGGGYCTYFPDYRSPFIFANFNGTSGDVDVLTHEVGHAFQVYSSRDYLPDYRWPTYEACEIHSMSMEFLAWPWIDKFFKDDTEKYKFIHLAGGISFLPYGVLVDEFQHGVYENPELSKAERKALWRRIEKKYLPFKDYDDDAFMEKGTFWYKQGHIFGMPFYYIDYTLAQVCAFEFWVNSQKDHASALKQYIELCELGGSQSFVQLLESSNLKNPFKKGSVKAIMEPLNEYLNGVDDTKL